jgi:hypothetical protein
MVKIYPTVYKDQPAITIESEAIRAQFLPSTGAKMASLIYKPRRYELLVQRPGEKYLLQPFDGDYVAGECSGFDDMFPTIDTCYYDHFPWQGTKMADHGEVWSLPYALEIKDERLHFTVHGVRFPYRLEKWVSYISPSILHLDYQLTNLSPFDFDFVWAGHNMINLEEGVELFLPPGVQKITRTFAMGAETAQYGDVMDWPVGKSANGSPRDFRRIRPKSARSADKYYINGRMPEGWCGLKYTSSDFTLGLSFPIETVPYLGVLPNEGGWQDIYNIFLEPCTGTFDRPDVARYRGEGSTVKGNSIYTWHLNFSLAEGVAFQRVNISGFLEE